MKKQIIAIFVAAIFLTGLVSVFLFVRREREIGLHWLTENSRSQLDLMGDLLESDLEKMKGQMARIATLMEAGQSDEAQKNLAGFVGVAAIDPETSGFLWKVQNAPSADHPTKDEWSAQWIQKLRDTKGSDTDVRFYASQTPEVDVRSAITLLASVRDRKSGQINKVRLIGIQPKALFQELIDKLKAQGVHIFLTTPSGLTLAHTISEYVGNSMVGDRTYEEIRKQKSIFGSILTKDVRGDDILSFFVKLPAGKLTLVSQWRKELWVTTDWGFYGQGLFMILALALFCGALAQYLLNRLQDGPVREITVEKIVERIVEKVVEKPVSAPVMQSSPVSKVAEVKTSLKSEPLPLPSRPSVLFNTPAATPMGHEPQVSLKILERVVAALRAPLLSVLGHVQIARLNPQGGSLQAIETEIRNARDVLDRVGQYSGQAQVPSVTVALYELVEYSLRSVEGALLRGGIKIVRELPVDLALKCDVDELKTAIAAVIRNAVEAMEKNLRKTLTLRATKQNGMIVFEIEDSGEGISAENLEKIFDPFFTTRSTLDHRGLGLAMASGVIRQHGGQVLVKSKVGEGTLITIKIPVSNEVVQSLGERGITQRVVRDFKTPSMEALEVAAMGEVPKEEIVLPADAKGDTPSSEKMTSPSVEEVLSSSPEETMDPLTLFNDELDDEEDTFGDFQFGRLDFSDPQKPAYVELNFSRAEGIGTPMAPAGEATPSSSPVKRLKKKEEPLAKMKVQIPRPEERL